MTFACSVRSAFMQMIGAGIGIIVAIVISRALGQDAIGWAIAVCIIAFTTQFVYVARDKRNLLRVVVWPIAAGLAAWLIFHFLGH